MTDETITAAAIQHKGMVCFVERPGRHHDVIREMARAGIPTPITGAQGFITSTGRFVGREEGRRIAVAQGQLIPCAGEDGVPFVREHRELFSEDVW